MKLLQTEGEVFVTPDQALVAGAPVQAALVHPAASQHEVAFGAAQLDHLQVEAVLLSGLGGCFSRVALVGTS